MNTFSGMQTRVTRRVIDLPSAVVAEVPQLVNVALTKLQEAHNFKVMEGELPVFTQALTRNILVSVGGLAVSLYTQIPNFKEWRGKPWYLNYVDGAPRPMAWAGAREAVWGMFTQGGQITLDTGYPQLLLEEPPTDQFNNHTISVYPVADGNSDFPDGEYRITIPFYTYLPPLVNSGDNNWITNQTSGEEYIVHKATAMAFALNWDYEKATVEEQLAKLHFDDIVRTDKRFRLSNVREWAVHWRGANESKTTI